MDRSECSMDTESRKQEYYRARGAAQTAVSSRRRMLRGRSFVRIWKGKIGNGMCSGWSSS